jgi:hypothetical protein
MYRITDFDKHYMTSDLKRKRVKRPSWFKCPIESPETITLIHTHDNGLAYLGIWERMQAWAVRNHDTNGAFILKSGPMSIMEITIHCTLPQTAPVEQAINALMCLGWLADVPDPECYEDVVVAPEELPTNSPPHDRTGQDKTGQDITWNPEDGWCGVSDSHLERWAEAFPAVDLDMQLAKMTAWLIANPAKAKRKLWARFITNWLSRTQERGGDIKSNPVQQQAVRPTESRGWANEARTG